MEDPKDQQLHSHILDQIKSGKVTMHSRAYLLWRGVLVGLALALLAAAGVFAVSFVVFSLRMSGVWDLPQFGTHGLQEFILFFPWLFIPAVLLFIWLLERFILRHSPAYRMPVLYSVGAMLVIILGASLLVLASPLHHRLYVYAEHQRLPLAGGMYRFFSKARPDDLYVGTVTATSGHTYVIKTPDNNSLTIVTDKNTRFLMPEAANVGDCVEIIGEENNTQITARSIREPSGPFGGPCDEIVPDAADNMPLMMMKISR